MPNQQDKINYLFKKSLLRPQTHKSKDFFQEEPRREGGADYNNYIFNKDIFVQKIPDDPSFNNPYLSLTDISGEFRKDRLGIIMDYSNVRLSRIPESEKDGTLGAWYCLDSSDNNILEDTIPYRYSYNGKNYPYKCKKFIWFAFYRNSYD